MSPYVANAGVFLIKALFGFVILILMLRILLQLVRANFFNPICQLLVRLTNPVLTPLRRIIPNYRQWDLSAIMLMWVVQVIELTLVFSIIGARVSMLAVLAVAWVDLLDLVLTVFMVVIVIKVILSWVAPQGDSPFHPLLYLLSKPILAPLQRHIPPLGGLDFSPWLALIGLQLIRMLVIHPLYDLAARL